MKKGLLSGTFDPPSLGHLDIIQRAAKLCDHLIIGIGTNLRKGETAVFTLEEKIAMLRTITPSLPQIEMAPMPGLAVDFAKKHHAHVLIRGLRAFSDFEYEFKMALANRALTGIETVFLMADERLAHISSSLIRELGHYGQNLEAFVPKAITAAVSKKFHSK